MGNIMEYLDELSFVDLMLLLALGLIINAAWHHGALRLMAPNQ